MPCTYLDCVLTGACAPRCGDRCVVLIACLRVDKQRKKNEFALKLDLGLLVMVSALEIFFGPEFETACFVLFFS